MHAITLYGIARGTKPNTFRVSRAYKMYIQTPLDIPKPPSQDTVYVNKEHSEWFYDIVGPIIERHNGDNIMQKWADDGHRDPSYVTIALDIQGEYIIPDVLANTTSFVDGLERHALIRKAIEDAIKQYNT